MESRFGIGDSVTVKPVRVYGKGTNFKEYSGKATVLDVKRSLFLYIYTVEVSGRKIDVFEESLI